MGLRRIASLAALALALAAPALAEPTDDQMASYGARPAGHSWRSMSTHAPELRPMLRAALEALPSRAPLVGIFRAEQQFLGAGMAYRLILVLADDSQWRVTLMPGAQGSVAVTEVERVPLP
jgi:hypothetical protein